MTEITQAVIDLLLLAASGEGGNGSITEAGIEAFGYTGERTPEDERIIGLAFDACALLIDADDYEEDESTEDYFIDTQLEAAQRLIEGRLVLL